MCKSLQLLFSVQLFVFVLIFAGCRGFGGEKEVAKDADIISSSDKPTTPTTHSDVITTKLSPKQLDSLYQAQAKAPIKLLKFEDNVVDEYNVKKQILEFKDPNTGQVIKTIDLVKENPFHKMGLKRIKERDPSVYYFLMKKGTENKQNLKELLPKEVFKVIPEYFEFYRAIAEVNVSTTDSRYATINYQLDWLPDAYSDQSEWDGPGYSVHIMVVYDSLGNNIYTRKFDGYSEGFNVSEDGKYLFNMACLSPEWDENIRYRFTVINLKTNNIAFEELIENCKHHGGGGDFIAERNLMSSAYTINKPDGTIKCYIYHQNKFYIQKEYKLINAWFLMPNRQMKVYYPDRPQEIVNITSFFTEVKLD